MKLHKNFVHFKYSLRVNKKNILGECLRSLSQVLGTVYTPNEQNCIETTGDGDDDSNHKAKTSLKK